MKHTHRCPKCGGEELVPVPGGMEGRNWLPVGLRTVPVDRWICCDCGFSEEWIPEDNLKKVKEYWAEWPGERKEPWN